MAKGMHNYYLTEQPFHYGHANNDKVHLVLYKDYN